MVSVQLGRVQLLIMQVLWNKGRAVAREITDAINTTEPIAHSTVQTLLRRLEDKGVVWHEVKNRTFVFFPLLEEHKFKQSATRDLMNRFFGGSAGMLVAYLLKNELPREEINVIRSLINRRVKKRIRA